MKNEKMPNSSRRIAKNVIYLYFRQILILLVSLYTVRVTLNTLGASDYGIYDLIAGIVVMFSFINGAMANGTQRFLNFYLGKNDEERANDSYSASIIIHLSIAIIFFIAAETVGLWFVCNKLNIPFERHKAAFIVYQFSIFTTIFSIMRVPFNALIIAYEKMNFFAMLGIIEALLKLGLVFVLQVFSVDKLILYGFLQSLVSILLFLIFKFYCSANFKVAHFKKIDDRSFVRKQLSFSAWNLFGAVANVSNAQGCNVVLNVHTSVLVNAAMGIANQVSAALCSFLTNMQTAFNPQIVKNYAKENQDEFHKLVFTNSKAAFFLITYIAVPLIINIDFVLSVWLKNIPDYSVHFVILIIIWALIDAWNGPFVAAISATGNIRKYQLIVSCMIFANLPLTILVLALRFPPESILVIRILENFIATLWRIFFVGKRIKLPVRKFFFEVLVRTVFVLIISFTAIYFLGALVLNPITKFFVTGFASVISTSLLIFLAGTNAEERKNIKKFITAKIGAK